jgi:hypothetical protein
MVLLHETLLTILIYNPETGIFNWKVNWSNNRYKAGDRAGFNYNVYRGLRLLNKQYYEHRLAWFYHYGKWPQYTIDHINGIKTDNRIENLRDVPIRINCQNRLRNQKGKLVGTSYAKSRNQWMSAIRLNNKSITLGWFDTEQEAHERYINELIKQGLYEKGQGQ